MKNSPTYIAIILIGIILLLLFRGPNKLETFKVDHTYENILKDSIASLNSSNINLVAKADSISRTTDTLYITLQKVKEIHDTIRIIEVQDSIIITQREEVITLRTKSDIKDLLITHKDELLIEVVTQKDAEIIYLTKQVRAEKRKKVVTMIVAGVVVVLTVIASI
tara:strand:+ start:10626 stop:11120 length:495 start_codon:yes stop_codon:yes gene_type:complete